ncbi:hypothetical protein F0249_19135 [Vibrio sp. 03-59-1]|uniref:hypothetical protein n=1 Tax=Vibrio sp. 03-59-1 TaxID=2607607 RepID=UPI001493BD3F|nr:hypothetical protein [Vibrio sp. 03-59-1]NOH85904.1 hypothetical protein [Vibrio sp. 03-59-1]
MSSNKSKSRSSNTTTNVSGQNAISGDNLGTAISGVNGSEINVNMTQTDHGAIEAASKTSQKAMDSIVAGYKGAGNMVADVHKDAFRFGESAIDANKDVHRDAFNFGESALDANQHAIDESLSMVSGAIGDATDLAGDVTKTAMEENRKANEAALAAATKAQNEAFSFGRESLGVAEGALDSSFNFGRDALDSNENISKAAMDMAADANRRVTESLSDALSSNESISKSAMSAAADANKRAFDFGSESLSDALDSNESISNKAIEKMRENARDTVDLANDMAGQSAQTTKEVIGLSETFAGVTEKTISQSQTGASDSMMKLGVATAIALSVAIAVRG